ncbi:unnamed protein product, partial [Effrenium voratum]
MRCDGSWGGSPELKAFVDQHQAFKIVVENFSPVTGLYLGSTTFVPENGHDRDLRVARLAYVGRNHFNLVLELGDPEPHTPPGIARPDDAPAQKAAKKKAAKKGKTDDKPHAPPVIAQPKDAQKAAKKKAAKKEEAESDKPPKNDAKTSRASVVRPRLIHKDDIAPDMDPQISAAPESGRKRAREAWKASGVHLSADKAWFMEGCPDEEGVRQRRARMTDAGANIAWDRFMLLVQFTDVNMGAWEEWGTLPALICQGYPSPGMLGSVVHYLALRHVTAFLDYYTWTDRVTKNREGPYTTGWIVTLQRSISALKSFINPDYLPEWSRKFKQAVANAKAELQRRSALFRRRDDLWEDDADVPEGGRMVRRPQITFAD